MKSMADCCEKISLEHGVSRNILEKWGEFATREVRFGPEKDIVLPAAKMGSNVLCERHNNALSPLDSYAGVLYDKLVAHVGPAFKGGGVAPASMYIDGPHLEAWALKVMAARWPAGFTQGGKRLDLSVDENLLIDAIQCGRFMPRGGLYVYANRIANEFEGVQHYGHLNLRKMRWVGVELAMAGLNIVVIFDPLNADWNDDVLTRSTYRPFAQRLSMPGGVVELHFGWPGKRTTIWANATARPNDVGSSSQFPFEPLPGPPEKIVKVRR